MATIKEIKQAAEARQFQALEFRREGKTYREIGELVGRADDPTVPVSAMLALTLVRRAVRKLVHPARKDHPLHGYAMELWGFRRRDRLCG